MDGDDQKRPSVSHSSDGVVLHKRVVRLAFEREVVGVEKEVVKKKSLCLAFRAREGWWQLTEGSGRGLKLCLQ